MAIDHIPISFEFDGNPYRGELVDVPGRAQRIWDLIINRYYFGMLAIRGGDFVFHPNPKHVGWEVMGSYFGAAVVGWWDGKNKRISG